MNTRSMGRIGFLIAGTLAATCAADVSSLPRYALPVGQKLTYVTTSGKEADANSSSRMTELTVLRENPDSSRHLLVHSVTTYTSRSVDGKVNKSEYARNATAEIFSDGRRPRDPLGAAGTVPDPLVMLPPDNAAIESGWVFDDPDRLATYSFKVVSDSAGEFVFASIRAGALARIYVVSDEQTYHFDRSRGLLAQVDSKTMQDFRGHSESTEKTVLKSAEMIVPEKLAPLAADFDAYFALQKTNEDLWDKAEIDLKVVDRTAVQVKSSLQSAIDSARSDEVKKLLASDLKDVDDRAKYSRDSGTAIAECLNKASPEWSASDLDGGPQSMAAYRGKIVVMDFWYRGCGWCMFATPAVKQLAADYKDKGVVILGMNKDREENDARFVAKEFALTYPIVKAQGIPEKYGIHGFPTLVIVDRSGIVRDFHVGYTRTLREDVGKKIDELLAENK